MKKNILFIATAVLGVCLASADTVLTVYPGQETRVIVPGKVSHVEVLSSVAAGTAAVKRVRDLIEIRDVVESTTLTNITYSLVYSNGTEIVTNTVDYDQSPFPSGMRYLSYTTNVATTVTSITNPVPTVVLSYTNDLCEAITCSGGFGFKDPTGKFVFPGDRIFFSGTAKGKVNVITED